MKKTLLLMALFAAFTFAADAQTAACTVDTSSFTASGEGAYVYPVSLPCATHGMAFTAATQTLKVPDTLSFTVDTTLFGFTIDTTIRGYVDSMQIMAITGVPAGLSDTTSPVLGVWLHAGQVGCVNFSGTPTAPAGNYPLTISGKACGHFTIPGNVPVIGGMLIDSCINYTFTNHFPDTLRVCPGAGISEVSQDINLNIYPNPNQGSFTVTVSSANEMSGTVAVLDQLGRTLTTQDIIVSGTKEVAIDLGSVATGAYLLVVNTQNGKSVKQFIVR